MVIFISIDWKKFIIFRICNLFVAYTCTFLSIICLLIKITSGFLNKSFESFTAEKL